MNPIVLCAFLFVACLACFASGNTSPTKQQQDLKKAVVSSTTVLLPASALVSNGTKLSHAPRSLMDLFGKPSKPKKPKQKKPKRLEEDDEVEEKKKDQDDEDGDNNDISSTTAAPASFFNELQKAWEKSIEHFEQQLNKMMESARTVALDKTQKLLDLLNQKWSGNINGLSKSVIEHSQSYMEDAMERAEILLKNLEKALNKMKKGSSK